jgi:hypothetical protein
MDYRKHLAMMVDQVREDERQPPSHRPIAA